ncbi:hypothetical protein [Cellulomonas fimi]|uniref:Uncharacterized protein n=1 Tax=Cellulomonas fimi TaxID=1708 RepID=A0A7Y0LWL7_CELFI|nr:hypothetical protein [Cellulomonas fimi]NMR19236.1 hypothetical protein [Cellulomonas fimi]
MSITRAVPSSPSTAVRPAPPSTVMPTRPAGAGGTAPHDGDVAAPPRPRRLLRGAVVAFLALLRGALADAAPRHGYQRAMYATAVVLLGSGIVHVGVWAVDGGAWEGAVSWRKPILFGVSFGMFLLSAGWVQGVLARSPRWGWTTTALTAGGGAAEVALITAQRWRGVASHFNVLTPVDGVIFGLMGVTIVVFGVGVAALALWAALRLRRPAPTVIGVLVGLGLVLVGSAIGGDLLGRGLAYVEANEAVPSAVVIGLAGSGKLAHAVALHGIQVLGVLALLLGRSGLGPATRTRTMVVCAAGYTVLAGLVIGQAYAGRSMLELAGPMVFGLALATFAVLAPFAVVVGDAVRGERVGAGATGG